MEALEKDPEGENDGENDSVYASAAQGWGGFQEMSDLKINTNIKSVSELPHEDAHATAPAPLVPLLGAGHISAMFSLPFWHAMVPLYAPLLLSLTLIVALLAWPRTRGAGRRRRGRCAGCGYAMRGLAVGAGCPECGASL